MLFGQMGAPAVFQRMMNAIFGDASDHVMAYLDNVVIFSKFWEDHVSHIHEALDRIRKARLTNAKKCQLAMRECLYLGHTVGRGTVKPNIAKIQAIQNSGGPSRRRM